MSQSSVTVICAISNTEKICGDYFKKNLETRTTKGLGSTYENMTPEQLREALMSASWTEVQHPAVAPGCQCFVTRDIPGGRFGLLKVKDLPDDTKFIAEDPKGTGKISICAAGCLGDPVEKTFLIIGCDEDQENPLYRECPIVFTFHPGPPVRPSLVSTETVKDGTILTKQQVLDLGFDLAKVDSTKA